MMRKIIFTAKKTTTAALIAATFGAMLAPAALAETVAEPKPVKQSAVQPLRLAANAPDRHVVVPGDTLWGIASKFLKDPYRWSELYQNNKADIKNPHWIYPGQVLVLDRSGATPRLGLETVKLEPREYVEAIKQPLWTVSPDAIAAWLVKPLVVEPGSLDNAARVVGLADNRQIIGAGDKFYVANVAQAQRDWQVFKLGETLIDPETNAVLGHEAIFLGDARQLTEGEDAQYKGALGVRQASDGYPATFVMRSSTMEVGTGAYLLPAPPAKVVDYVPRAPSRAIRPGHVLGMAGGLAYAGRNDVLSINRGSADGIMPGHVLAVDRAGDRIDDRYQGIKTTMQLPDQRNGLIFIFRTFEHVSYGLVMEAGRAIVRGDAIRTP